MVLESLFCPELVVVVTSEELGNHGEVGEAGDDDDTRLVDHHTRGTVVDELDDLVGGDDTVHAVLVEQADHTLEDGLQDDVLARTCSCCHWR